MKCFLASMLAVCSFYLLPLYSQSHLNIRYTDGSDKNVPFASLQKITFDESGDSVNIRLTDATTQAVAFTALQKMTSADAGAGSLLPVEFLCFTATANRVCVLLSWRTATEVNNYGFAIERRSINAEWCRLGFVEGSGTTNAPKVYSFADSNLSSGKYSYRLKQIDRDGKFQYANEVEVNIDKVQLKFSLSQNFPNPFNPSTTISYQMLTESFVEIKVFDMIGREVATLVNENKKAGSHEVAFDGSRLSSGVYICKMNSIAYSSVIKMTIMK